MVKETGKKCSNCGHNGHNSRTCNGCVRLFGARIGLKQENLMKKSLSMGNLQSHAENSHGDDANNAYLSDGQIHSKNNKAAIEGTKAKPWTVEEHRIFLAGLRKLGKGDWSGISRNFVKTRTPTQVASHAQKYFLRQQAGNDKKKRRTSLFDMAFHELKSNASDPPASPSEETAKNTSKMVNRFPHLCLDHRPAMLPTASQSFPTFYHGIQPMVGQGPNGQGIAFVEAKMMPCLPFVHAMPLNYAGPGYNYMVKAPGNVVFCTPVAHPSGIPSPVLVQHSMSRPGPAFFNRKRSSGA